MLLLPSGLDELIAIVQKGIDDNLPVRAVGSGHSFSSAPKSEGLLVCTDKLGKIEQYPYAGNSNFIEVQGGIKLHHLNEKLESLNLCIPTMGGIDHQSIAGAISTGTHGSSHLLGGMSKMVRSMVLVTQDLNDSSKAKAYRIEPASRPLNDSATCAGPDLIQDDDIFNAAVVCFGMMGLIYSYVMEVEPMYYLSECRKVTTWSDLKPKLKSREIFNGFQSVLVQINPYKVNNEDNLALTLTQERYEHTDKSLLMQLLEHKFWDNIKRMTRSVSYVLASIFPYFLYIMIWRINKFPGYVPRFVNSAIKSQRDEDYINKGHKVMYQGLDYIKERAYDCELVVKMDMHGEYLNFIDELIMYLAWLHKEFQVHITSPLGLRFVKSSSALITPEYGYDVCYIDTPVLKHIYGREVLLNKIQKFALARGARLHWGKLNFQMDVNDTKQLYPEYDKFMGIIKRFNPNRIFSNSFTKRVVGY